MVVKRKRSKNNCIDNGLKQADRALFIKSPSTSFSELLGIGAEEYCRYVWSYRISKDNWPWRAIGNRQSGKRTTTLKDFYLDASIGMDCSIDCFISPNEFFDWRNVKQLAALHSNWLEIDITRPVDSPKEGKQSLSAEEEDEVVREVFDQLKEAGIPAPSCYVLSGSGGLHLYWIYDAVAAYKWRVNAWREIARKLVKSLRGGKLWHVDLGASKDPARVLRMPGTRHGSTKRTVELFTGGNRYSFESLASSLAVPVEKDNPFKLVANTDVSKPQKTPIKDVKRKPKSSVNDGRHTIGQWWFKVFTHVHSYISRNKVTEGRRDSTAFILYVALRHIQDEDTALSRVIDINKRLIGLEEETLIKYLKTARKTLYKYKKDTLADYLSRQLDMDVSWLYKDEKKLTPEEVKQAQRQSAVLTAQKKNYNTLERILKAGRELLLDQAPLTQASVAAICGRSERTVRRYWKALLEHEDIRSASIYSPPT